MEPAPPDVKFLQQRAAEYRRLAESARDRDVRESCLLLARIDDEQADELEAMGRREA